MMYAMYVHQHDCYESISSMYIHFCCMFNNRIHSIIECDAVDVDSSSRYIEISMLLVWGRLAP